MRHSDFDCWTSEDGRVTLYRADEHHVRERLMSVPGIAIVTDPPYGVRYRSGQSKRGEAILGDDAPPNVAWMHAHPSIVWGGNSFADQLPRSTGWLVWFKHHPDCAHHSQAELAWTNVTRTVRHFSMAYHGFMRNRSGDGHHHPTQKPTKLMEWCIGFTNAAATIVDPYMGSGSTGIAAVRAGRRFVGVEVDLAHYATARQRIQDELSRVVPQAA